MGPDQRRYALGYLAGVVDAAHGIVSPEHGYPDDELHQRGRAHGRADYLRRVESLLTPREMPASEIPPRRML